MSKTKRKQFQLRSTNSPSFFQMGSSPILEGGGGGGGGAGGSGSAGGSSGSGGGSVMGGGSDATPIPGMENVDAPEWHDPLGGANEGVEQSKTNESFSDRCKELLAQGKPCPKTNKQTQKNDNIQAKNKQGSGGEAAVATALLLGGIAGYAAGQA